MLLFFPSWLFRFGDPFSQSPNFSSFGDDRKTNGRVNPSCLFLPRILVNRSAIFAKVRMYHTTNIFAATASRIRWYAIALCFFFNVDDGRETLRTTLLLSHSIVVGPTIGTPNILNLYRMSIIASVATLPAANSAPCVEDSTVGCRLLIHLIGVEFRKMTTPVVDRRVIKSVAWSASTYAVNCPFKPRGVNWSDGSSSVAPG